MPSALDIRLREATARLTAPGQLMATTTFNQYGVDLPMIAAAPPAMNGYFLYFCTVHAAEEAIVSGEERITYGALLATATKIAGALIADHGVKTGDRVGIAMRNAPSWIALYMGVLMAGGVAT